MKQRNCRIDNIRYLLIALVVFGHLIERLPQQEVHFLYSVIYVFHMPAFVFISGFFARFRARRLAGLAIAYGVFQALYVAYDTFIWGSLNLSPLELCFQPEWLTWYLFASTVWILLLPLIKTQSRLRMGVTLALSICIALAAGYCDAIGRFFSLSRILVFWPFFIAGYYAHRICADRFPKSDNARGMRTHGTRADAVHGSGLRRMRAVIGAIGVIATVALIASGNVTDAMLYEAEGYSLAGGTAFLRLLLMCLAACWICLLFAAVPQKRIPVVSEAGSHTMPIYLLHGFVVRPFMAYGMFGLNAPGGIACAAALSLALTFALGNRYLDKIVRFRL